MSEMIERVARAICSAQGCQRAKLRGTPCVKADLSNDECRATTAELVLTDNWPSAVAAIQAMREPTVAMEKAALIDHDIQGPVYLRGAGAWRAMIDAALNEKPNG